MSHDDFQTEPVRGLPGRPPGGERVLWQGAPDPILLARHALALRLVLGWFALLALWRGAATGMAEGAGAGVSAALLYLVAGALAGVILLLIGYAMARSTVYTITDRRVAMRIGVALTVTLNIPYRWIGAADLRLRPDGSGDIVLTTLGETRFAWMVLWPHAAPWSFARTRPSLRCLRDAKAVADLLGEAARASISETDRNRTHEGDAHARLPVAAE
jgi:hypothetical protein